MLYPVGAPTIARSLTGINRLEFSEDGNLGAAISDTSINIILLQPIAKLCSCLRSSRSLRELGTNKEILWNERSNKIVVSTTNGSCLLFSLVEERHSDVELYHTLNSLKRSSFAELALKQIAVVSIGSTIDAFCGVGERYCVADSCGNLRQFHWADGLQAKNQNRKLSTIPFAFDLHPSRASLLGDQVRMRCLRNAISSMSGLLCVLSDGRAAMLACESTQIDFNHMQGVFAPNVSDAVTVCHNRKLCQLIVATKSGNVLIYVMNEMTNELVMTCKYEIRQKVMSSTSKNLFATEMTLALEGRCLCAVLNNGTYQLYSIFGSLLFDTHHAQFSKSKTQVARVSPCGYQLWICLASSSRDHQTSGSLSPGGGFYSVDRRSVTLTQPLLQHSPSILSSQFGESFIVLQGVDRVLVGSNRDFDSTDAIKCWQQAMMPLSYLRGGSVVKFSCVDKSGSNIAVASQYGIALYNFEQLKWKLFGNEIQEREISVCAGMIWLEEFIVFTCRNNESSRFELRVYNRLKNLENNFKTSIVLSHRPVAVNLYHNFFSVFDNQSNLFVYKLNIQSSQSPRTCEITKVQETPLHMFVPYSNSVLSIMFTDVAHQMGNHPVKQETPRSFLINVAGRLAIFPRDPLVEELEIPEQVPLCTPTVIASNVESMALYNSYIPDIPRSQYFEDAVWLMCGASGLKIWLPLPVDLNHSDNESFKFKRSVFVFHPSIYPLALECNSGFIMGVDTENLVLDSLAGMDILDVLSSPDSSGSAKSANIAHPLANYSLSKTLEIFIPHLIEEMLRRNLNSHAVRLMKSIHSLSSFDHMLELLLHNVLEAEATPSDPIADPLLPSVIGLLNQQYRTKFLKILAKCARKSEVAIWSFLFNAAGNPANYFRRCIEEDELSTAASYLIILQSLEPLSVSKQYANVLVDTCLDKRDWLLVRDIIRFLKSIAASSGDEVSPKVCQGLYSVYTYPQMTPNVTTPNSANAPNHAAPSSSSRTKSSSQSSAVTSSHSGSKGGSVTSAGLSYPQKTSISRVPYSLGYSNRYHPRSFSTESDLNSMVPKMASSDGSSHRGSTSATHSLVGGVSSQATTPQQQPDSSDIFYLSSLIARKARTLLVGYELRQLFVMASHIGFNLTSWLKRERNRAAKIESYEKALESLHIEFDWPFPVLADQSKLEADGFKSSTLSSSSPTSSVVTLQDFPPPSHGNEFSMDFVLPSSSKSKPSPPDVNNLKSNPIPVPKSAAWIHSDSQASLYSSLNAGPPGNLTLDLENLSLDGMSCGLPPNQNALQHARLQLADLSSSVESNNAMSFSNSNIPLNNSQDDTSTWSDDVTTTAGHAPHQPSGEAPPTLETSSLLVVGTVTETAHNQLSQSADLESLVLQFRNKGSEKSTRLLKHALGVMVESECYEWAILICMMLSDVTQAISIINNIIGCSSLTDVGHRLINGLTSLDSWAAQNCFTYRLFLAALFPYVQVLKTVMDFSFKAQKGKKLSTGSTGREVTPKGLLMPALEADKCSNHKTPTTDAMTSGANSQAANRRLSWWKGSRNSSSNQSDQSVFASNDISVDAAEKDKLCQVHEERIEWLSDNYRDLNGNDISGGSCDADIENGSFSPSSISTNLNNLAEHSDAYASQKCIIS